MSKNFETPKGLHMQFNFITPEEEKYLLDCVDNSEWNNQLRRRTQHYGFIYDYSGGPLEKTKPFPQWAKQIAEKMINEKFITKCPDQMIVNEYNPGQGIGKHIDSDMFEDTIISLSLNSACLFRFSRNPTSFGKTKSRYDVNLKPRTLVIMEGESRYEWSHQIPAIKKERRVSLTFRYVPFDTKYRCHKSDISKWVKKEYEVHGWKFFDSIIEYAEDTIDEILKEKEVEEKTPKCKAKVVWNYFKKIDFVKEAIYEKYIQLLET